jgi:transposase-like protein
VDETYVKVAGRWRYVYRAIDQFGQVIDVFVSAHRDAKAARRFFEQAIARPRWHPLRWSPTERRRTRWCSRSYCRHRGIEPSRMPTIELRATMGA